MRAKHRDEEARLEQFCSAELETLAQSISVHRSDNAAVEHPSHFAATANVAAHAALTKTSSVFKAHRKLHQSANAIKHESSNGVDPSPIDDPAIIMAYTRCCSQLSFVPFSGAAWNLNAAIFVPGSPLYDIAGASREAYPPSDDESSDASGSIYSYSGLQSYDTRAEAQASVYHWTNDLHVDLLDLLHRQDPGIFDSDPNQIPRHLQQLADQFHNRQFCDVLDEGVCVAALDDSVSHATGPDVPAQQAEAFTIDDGLDLDDYESQYFGIADHRGAPTLEYLRDAMGMLPSHLAVMLSSICLCIHLAIAHSIKIMHRLSGTAVSHATWLNGHVFVNVGIYWNILSSKSLNGTHFKWTLLCQYFSRSRVGDDSHIHFAPSPGAAKKRDKRKKIKKAQLMSPKTTFQDLDGALPTDEEQSQPAVEQSIGMDVGMIARHDQGVIAPGDSPRDSPRDINSAENNDGGAGVLNWKPCTSTARRQKRHLARVEKRHAKLDEDQLMEAKCVPLDFFLSCANHLEPMVVRTSVTNLKLVSGISINALAESCHCLHDAQEGFLVIYRHDNGLNTMCYTCYAEQLFIGDVSERRPAV